MRAYSFHRVFDCCDCLAFGKRRTANHMDREAEAAGGFDLGVSGIASRIFRQHEVDAVIAKQRGIVVGVERSARSDNRCGGEFGRQSEWINHAGDIMVLRAGRELRNRRAAERGKNPARCAWKRGDRGRRRCVLAPVVARDFCPGRAFEGDERDFLFSAGENRIGAHLGRERVRRVDYKSDAFVCEIAGQAFDTTEAAAPHRQRARRRVERSSRKRQRGADCGLVRQISSEPRSFACAAEQQDVLAMLSFGFHYESAMP